MTEGNDWKVAVLQLLTHFDEMEGTTYLYNKGAREGLYKLIPPSVLPAFKDAVERYHAFRSKARRS